MKARLRLNGFFLSHKVGNVRGLGDEGDDLEGLPAKTLNSMTHRLVDILFHILSLSDQVSRWEVIIVPIYLHKEKKWSKKSLIVQLQFRQWIRYSLCLYYCVETLSVDPLIFSFQCVTKFYEKKNTKINTTFKLFSLDTIPKKYHDKVFLSI